MSNNVPQVYQVNITSEKTKLLPKIISTNIISPPKKIMINKQEGSLKKTDDF